MHIPDGYLSPATAALAFGAAAPFWYQASRKAKQLLRSEAAPLVAMFSAFSFTVQMFNFPLPGGTTGHAVGGTLIAVALGPWPAVVAVSTALVIQALFFGDGGITAIGANSFNMAIVLPLVGYAVYRLAAGRSPSPRRRVLAAAAGSYAGINAAGLLAAVELGLQPVLWSEGGRALYSPYGLDVTLPAMMLAHLTVAGFAEAGLTALALSYLLRTHPEIVLGSATGRDLGGLGRGLVAALALLAFLTPVGLLARGSAPFEWSVAEVQSMTGYAPAGLAALRDLWWGSPLAGYQFANAGGSTLEQAPSYLLSAVTGIALIFSAILGARMVFARRTRGAE